MELPSALLTQTSKNKKDPPRKPFLFFREWKFLTLRLRNSLYLKEMELSSFNIKGIYYIFSK